MNIDLKIFQYRLLGSKDKAPIRIDYKALELTNDPELFTKEYTNWNFEYRQDPEGHEVYITSQINVPCGLVHNDPTLAGTFYRYEGGTTFIVTSEPITAEIIGELALVHLSRFPPIISMDTIKKSKGNYVHFTNIYCLAKLIVFASTRF